MVKDNLETEWKYTVQIGWGFFSADAGATWSITAPPGLFPKPLLIQLTKPSYACAERVVDALNRIYFPRTSVRE